MTPTPGDALIVVDVQNDFLAGGSLAVPGGDEILAPLNRCLALFSARRLPVFATRDWHPSAHCSFAEHGGPWPSHCVAGSEGAEFSAELRLPTDAVIVSKATDPWRDAYSGFERTDLEGRLRALSVRRVCIGGLATDYCVRATATDALRLGFAVTILRDCVRAVDYDAGLRALDELAALGAALIPSLELAGTQR